MHMAEGLILPEANQILLLTADGLQWTGKTADWSASTEVFAFPFCSCLFSKSKDLQLKQEAQLHA